MAFQLVQTVYWLALATWFGGALFIAIAAPIIFRTIRERNPIVPGVLSENLEGQHGTLLAGEVVGSLLNRLAQVEMLCGGVLFLTMIAQLFLIDLQDNNLAATIIRWAAFAAAMGLVIYEQRILLPRIRRYREEYIEHADEPEMAEPARERFDRDHGRSVMALQAMLFLLLGLILFSGSIMPRRTMVSPKATPNTVGIHGSGNLQNIA